MTDFYAARAQNAEIWDAEGRRFVDFGGGIAVVNTGHRHPKQVAAISAQLNEGFLHTAYQIVPYESYVELAEKVNTRTPGNFQRKRRFSPQVQKLLRMRLKSLSVLRLVALASSHSQVVSTAAQ